MKYEFTGEVTQKLGWKEQRALRQKGPICRIHFDPAVNVEGRDIDEAVITSDVLARLVSLHEKVKGEFRLDEQQNAVVSGLTF